MSGPSDCSKMGSSGIVYMEDHETLLQICSCFATGGNHYTGPIQCAKDIVRREGAKGLLRGWTAQYVRLGPQTSVIFIVMEQLRQLSGLGSL